MSKHGIPFNKPFVAGKELYYIAQAVIENEHLAGNGMFTGKCQEWLESTLSTGKAFLTNSCTAALEMSAILANIGPGDEVIMPSFTFVSTANAFVLRGATPVFVDIRPDTLNIDERLVRDAITEKTAAVVPVHYAGCSCEMNVLHDIAQEFSLTVIEDAAQALLSTYHNKYLGTIGHMGCLSFHETKNIICGEGGALLINDLDLVERAEIIWEKGTNRKRFFKGEVDKYTWVDIGSSFLPSELAAAFLYAQFERTHEIIARRRRIYDRYMSNLQPLVEKGRITLPLGSDNAESNGHIFYVITGSLDERTLLMKHLGDHGIHAVFHYVPLHSSPAGMKFGRAHGELAVTDAMNARLLRLPLYFQMTNAEVDQVSEQIIAFYEKLYNG